MKLQGRLATLTLFAHIGGLRQTACILSGCWIAKCQSPLTQAAANHVQKYIINAARHQHPSRRETTGSGPDLQSSNTPMKPAEDMVFSFGTKVFGSTQEFLCARWHRARLSARGLNEGFKFNNPRESPLWLR